MILYCVMDRTWGEYEPNAVYSIWTTRDEAEREIARLRTKPPALEFYVAEVEADAQRDRPL